MNSSAATITLTATLSQSLNLSLVPETLSAAGDMFVGANNLPLTITARWVRGPGSISMQAFSPANPLLGYAGRDRILVGTATPPVDRPQPAPGTNFLSAAGNPPQPALPALQLHTKDLQIPSGSEGATLTIRAEVI
jgi:hypothetical protein